MKVGNISIVDFATLAGASVLLWFFGMAFGTRKITRPEGAVMVVCFIAYTIYLVVNA